MTLPDRLLSTCTYCGRRTGETQKSCVGCGAHEYKGLDFPRPDIRLLSATLTNRPYVPTLDDYDCTLSTWPWRSGS